MGTIIKISAIIAILGTIGAKELATRSDDILASTSSVVNEANVAQLSNALELYYLDHNSYPPVQDGTQMINILQSGKYIRNRPLDPSAFFYQSTSDGNDYVIGLKAKK